MTFLTTLADAFGLRQTPWVMRVYLIFLLICVGLIIWGDLGKQPVDHPDLELPKAPPGLRLLRAK
jgi:hypothetical protein